MGYICWWAARVKGKHLPPEALAVHGKIVCFETAKPGPRSQKADSRTQNAAVPAVHQKNVDFAGKPRQLVMPGK